jgi:hypothetical protein
MVPMCFRCHRVIHDAGRETFATEHGIVLADLAVAYDLLWTGWAEEKLAYDSLED